MLYFRYDKLILCTVFLYVLISYLHPINRESLYYFFTLYY